MGPTQKYYTPILNNITNTFLRNPTTYVIDTSHKKYQVRFPHLESRDRWPLSSCRLPTHIHTLHTSLLDTSTERSCCHVVATCFVTRFVTCLTFVTCFFTRFVTHLSRAFNHEYFDEFCHVLLSCILVNCSHHAL